MNLYHQKMAYQSTKLNLKSQIFLSKEEGLIDFNGQGGEEVEPQGRKKIWIHPIRISLKKVWMKVIAVQKIVWKQKKSSINLAKFFIIINDYLIFILIYLINQDDSEPLIYESEETGFLPFFPSAPFTLGGWTYLIMAPASVIIKRANSSIWFRSISPYLNFPAISVYPST